MAFALAISSAPFSNDYESQINYRRQLIETEIQL